MLDFAPFYADSGELSKGMWNVEVTAPASEPRASGGSTEGEVIAIKRTAPCLLPEKDQVQLISETICFV